MDRTRRRDAGRSPRNRKDRRLRPQDLDLLGDRARPELDPVDAHPEILGREASLDRSRALLLGVVEERREGRRAELAGDLGAPHEPLLGLVAEAVALGETALDRPCIETRRRTVRKHDHVDPIPLHRGREGHPHLRPIVDVDPHDANP